MSASGGEPVVSQTPAEVRVDLGCVKTHTSAKCRKYNSPTWYRAESAQNDLASCCAIFPRCFYVRGGRSSFHAAKTQSRPHCVFGRVIGLLAEFRPTNRAWRLTDVKRLRRN